MRAAAALAPLLLVCPLVALASPRGAEGATWSAAAPPEPLTSASLRRAAALSEFALVVAAAPWDAAAGRLANELPAAFEVIEARGGAQGAAVALGTVLRYVRAVLLLAGAPLNQRAARERTSLQAARLLWESGVRRGAPWPVRARAGCRHGPGRMYALTPAAVLADEHIAFARRSHWLALWVRHHGLGGNSGRVTQGLLLGSHARMQSCYCQNEWAQTVAAILYLHRSQLEARDLACAERTRANRLLRLAVADDSGWLWLMTEHPRTFSLLCAQAVHARHLRAARAGRAARRARWRAFCSAAAARRGAAGAARAGVRAGGAAAPSCRCRGGGWAAWAYGGRVAVLEGQVVACREFGGWVGGREGAAGAEHHHGVGDRGRGRVRPGDCRPLPRRG